MFVYFSNSIGSCCCRVSEISSVERNRNSASFRITFTNGNIKTYTCDSVADSRAVYDLIIMQLCKEKE